MTKINPNLIKLAELTHNPDLKVDETILEKKVDIETLNVPNLNGFVYVPSIKLYVAKERTLNGKNWYGAHEELHKQGLQMLTIPEFIGFIKYLKKEYQNRKEAKQILDEILTVRNPWRAEWLDASFKVINEKLHINYNHRTINGELKPGNSEPLEDCLMENKTPGIDLDYWLNNPTKQGLPRKDTPKGKIWYWNPEDKNVAWFYTCYNVVVFECTNDSDRSPGLITYGHGTLFSNGVHAAKTRD